MCVDVDFFRFTFEFTHFLIVHSGVLFLFVWVFFFWPNLRIFQPLFLQIFLVPCLLLSWDSDGINFRSLLEAHMSLKFYSFFSPLYFLTIISHIPWSIFSHTRGVVSHQSGQHFTALNFCPKHGFSSMFFSPSISTTT